MIQSDFHFFIGNLTISMAVFNSYVSLPEGIWVNYNNFTIFPNPGIAAIGFGELSQYGLISGYPDLPKDPSKIIQPLQEKSTLKKRLLFHAKKTVISRKKRLLFSSKKDSYFFKPNIIMCMFVAC